MPNKWPESDRGNPASNTTYICRTTDVTCLAHVLGTSTVVSLANEAPGVNGNGHPLDASATHWGRCATCDRLYIVVPGADFSIYRQVSQLHELEDTAALPACTTIDEGAPTTAQFGLSDVIVGGDDGDAYHPILQFPAFATQAVRSVSSKSRIIKAQLHMTVDSFEAGAEFTAYPMVVAVDMENATWNSPDGVVSWGAPGAQDNEEDYDGDNSLGTVAISSTGEQVILESAEFVAWLNSISLTGGYVILRSNTANDFALRRSDDGDPGERPRLVLWHQTNPRNV